MQNTQQNGAIGDRLNAIKESGHEGLVYLLLQSGLGSEVVAIGDSYDDMWDDATRRLKLTRQEMLKQGYMFDVAHMSEAQKLVPTTSGGGVFDRMAKVRAGKLAKKQEQEAA